MSRKSGCRFFYHAQNLETFGRAPQKHEEIFFSPLGIVLTFFRSELVDLYGTDLLESGSLNSAFKDTFSHYLRAVYISFGSAEP